MLSEFVIAARSDKSSTDTKKCDQNSVLFKVLEGIIIPTHLIITRKDLSVMIQTVTVQTDSKQIY